MSRQIKLLGAFAALALVAGCDSTDSDNQGGGSIVYVAVGNSLTAGFQSGGLRGDWQMQSYPALLAKQMGLDDFQLPIIDSPGVGRTKIAGQTTIPLYVDSAGGITTKLLDRPVAELLSNRTLERPYNDLGVPGCTTLDFMNAYDSNSAQSKGNGLFNIVLRPSLFNNTSMMRQAISLHPTVMTMWIGNNDILGGLTAGTVIEGVTVTPVSVYSALMDKALDTLLRETSAHIFLANIPTIPTIPYVTSVPRFVFDPKTWQADTTTPLVTMESNVKYVLLPALSELAKGAGIPTAKGGTGAALGPTLTLTEAEAATASNLVDGYNAYLKAKAEANPDRLTLVDINALLEGLQKGDFPGLTSLYYPLDPTHTAFSLDGIHPNSKGYKQVANAFIKAVNAVLGKTFPVVE